MKKLPLCLTAVICFSLLNVASADSMTDCGERVMSNQYREAFPFCQKACNLNNGLACSALGVLYDAGHGVRQNLQTAKEYYGKACDLGLQISCDAYRRLNEKGY